VHPRSELVQQAARADFLMLLVPYSPQTHHLVNREVIAAMKPTAFLINLARGGVLDEAALIERCRPARSPAPASTSSPRCRLRPTIRFGQMPNVIITPNIGGRSDRFVEQTMTGAGAEHRRRCRRADEGPAQSRGALTFVHTAYAASPPSFRPSERSERVPESIISQSHCLWSWIPARVASQPCPE
jgi:phosphoglycerate dehydrogenase-like enzyme